VEATRRPKDASFSFSKNRHGRFQESNVFEQLFEEVVAQCLAVGLVKLSVDGTLVSTQGFQLVYGNLVRDNFWGICSYHEVPYSRRKYGIGRHCNGAGQNLLGNILVQGIR
jgi:hypothetical protein